MRKRVLVAVAIWLAGAALAAIGVTAALNFLGDGAFGVGGQVLTKADVQRDLAQAPAPASASAAPATPGRSHPPGTSSPRPSAATGTKHASGGTVVASCSGGQVTLTGWFAAQGYQIDGASRGPAESAWVKFRGASAEQTVSVTCAGGRPQFAVSLDNRGGGAAVIIVAAAPAVAAAAEPAAAEPPGRAATARAGQQPASAAEPPGRGRDRPGPASSQPQPLNHQAGAATGRGRPAASLSR